jgi:hypothetical protein
MVVVDLYAFSPPFHGFFHTAYVTAPSVRNSSGLHALPAGAASHGAWSPPQLYVRKKGCENRGVCEPYKARRVARS